MIKDNNKYKLQNDFCRMALEENMPESLVGIFYNLRNKHFEDADYENLGEMAVNIQDSQGGEDSIRSLYVIDWGNKIKISGKSSLTPEELRKELKAESRRIIKYVPVLFEEDIIRRAKENRTSDEFWQEYFTEDGAFMI
jgi:hypothetical protein